MTERFDRIWHNARLATMRQDAADLGAVEDGVIASRDGRIVFAGSRADFPTNADAAERIDCAGRWITPGLVDCHTHLVYGGNRAHEFELRLKGASYEEIARAGGGIVSTVAATRKASEAELVAGALPRLDALIAEGVTTIEIKSGYGLDAANEAKMLRVARALGVECGVDVRTTFLGAHALPPEFAGRADAYIDAVCTEMLPAIARAGLADAVDAFCENIGFTAAQTRRVFDAAGAHGLPVKLHAEQLSDTHGAALAAEFGALSADHLEYLGDDGIAAMATAGTVAVLLPGAFTPTCSAKHVPSYLANYDALKKAGVDDILCISVNDAFVMGAWARDQHAGGKVRMMADGSADYTKKLGLELDLTARGMGVRCQRFSMLVDDGVVKALNVEAPGKFEVSDGATMLKQAGG
jgi:imidazolonepropionase